MDDWLLLTTHFISRPPPYCRKVRCNRKESPISGEKKEEVQVNHSFQAAFHLLGLQPGGLQLILDQVLWPNLPLRLLYGSKLKWLCVPLEQITSRLNGYSQLPLAGGTKEASIV